MKWKREYVTGNILWHLRFIHFIFQSTERREGFVASLPNHLLLDLQGGWTSWAARTTHAQTKPTKASRGREGKAAFNFPTLRSPTPMTALSSSTTTRSLSATMGWVAREEQTARPASQNARKHKSGVKIRISAFLSFRRRAPNATIWTMDIHSFHLVEYDMNKIIWYTILSSLPLLFVFARHVYFASVSLLLLFVFMLPEDIKLERAKGA